MILPPLALPLALALALTLALPVMSLCQKFVKCQKFKSCRQKFAMPLLQTTRHYYAPVRREALKSRRGPHVSIILEHGGPHIYCKIMGGGGIKGPPNFL